MTSLPTGTVTFIFTDIASSSKLWERHPAEMKTALARHDEILRQAVDGHGGRVVKTTGDGVHAVFDTAIKAITAALAAQQALQAEDWAEISPDAIRVRMGLHTGETEQRAGDYYGSAVNRAARLMSVGHGGQILLSNVSAELVREALPSNASLRDLGEHRLKDLAHPERIYQLEHPDLLAEFPPLNTSVDVPNNLPLQLSSFIGRQVEITEISDLLKSARLVTLTGPGGTGKTRLGTEVAARQLNDFQEGVWLIELAPLSAPEQIMLVIGQTLGLMELPFVSLAEMVIDFLRAKRALLILDNCEHLIDACARLAEELLSQCSRLHIIASSREPLGIVGEAVYRIPSLAEGESSQLFVERARMANPKFSLTGANAASIAQICTRLDGIPLAIELAAARVRLLSPEQIAARLDDRFRLLIGGSRTALPRQQTLQALIDWSYDLLSEEEKHLLQVGSVFAGGWSLDALEAVADDPNAVEHLEGLINKSMVYTLEGENEMRYFMLETIRQYAQEKLFAAGGSVRARDRHFGFYNDLSGVMWEAARGANDIFIRETVYDEADNLRQALIWGMEHHVEAALHLAANNCLNTSWIGRQVDGLTLLQNAIDRFQSLPPVEGEGLTRRQKSLAKAWYSLGMVGMSTIGRQYAIDCLQKAIALARLTGDKVILGYSLEMYFNISFFFNTLSAAAEVAVEGFAIFSEIDDRVGWTMALLNMARLEIARNNYPESQRYFELLKNDQRDSPVSVQMGMVYFSMGMNERAAGHLESAKKHFEEALKIFTDLRHIGFANTMLCELGHIARKTGDFTQAKTIYQQTIYKLQDFGNRGGVAHQLECFAMIAQAEGESQRAAKLFGAAEVLREKANSSMTESERGDYEQAVASLKGNLDQASFQAGWLAGRGMTMNQAIEYAIL